MKGHIMQILLTGGTGFVGSAVLSRLLASGHTVTAIVRSEESAEAVSRTGVSTVIGDLTDSGWLAGQLRGVDGAIHTAAPDDGSAATMDDAVIEAALAAFAGTTKPFVYTTGVWVYGPGSDVSETDPFAAPEITSWRQARQERLLGGGIAASVVSPGIVYGFGRGIPGVIVDAPRTADGAVTLVGSGDQHWSTVHVDDLADLYLAVLERGTPGEVYIGASGTNPTVREIGQAVAGQGGTVAPDGLEATRARLGAAFADALLLDQQASGAKAKTALGWNPVRPTLVEELRAPA
jgi:nucleoside-diphosphate-sugar epimerase